MLINYGNYVHGTNTFPLAYTQNVSIANSGDYSWSGTDNNIPNKTLASFKAKVRNTSVITNYIAIGI